MLIILSVKSQTSDSTETVLQHYKSLYENRLINSAEYQRLKGKLLYIPFDINTDPDSSRAKALHERYHGRITGGVIMMSLGMTMLIGDGVIYQLALRNNTAEDLRGERAFFLPTGLVGGVTAVVGGIVFGLGMKDKFIFCNEYLAIGFTCNDNQIGLAYNF